MTKIKKFTGVVLTSLLVILLVSCDSSKALSNKSLDNYTMTRTVSGISMNESDLVYIVEKDLNSYKVTENEETHFYMDFGSVTYEYKTEELKVEKESEPEGEESDGEETSEDTKITYVTSTLVEVELSNVKEALESLTKGQLTLKEKGVYALNSLKENAVISSLINGILLDDVTDLKEAYDRGLIEVDDATLTLDNNQVKDITIKFSYANQNIVINTKFSKIGETSVEIEPESTVDKAYNSYLASEKAPIVSLNFKGYGKIQVQLFVDENANFHNAVNYFLYLFKNNYYSKANVTSASTSLVKFGKASKELTQTISTNTTHDVQNKRGTLALIFHDDDDKLSSELIFNLGDNSKDFESKGYCPIGGIISGYSVLDSLSGISEDENVKVTITIKYNGFTYEAPNFTS